MSSSPSPRLCLARQPKSKTLTVPSSRTLMFAGFKSRWMTPASCAASSASAICFRDRQRLIQRDRSRGDSVGEGRPSDQLQDERLGVVALLDAVDLRDVGVVQAGEHLRFPLEPREAIRVSREGVGEDVQGDVAAQVRVGGATNLPHPPFADEGGHVVMAEAGAGGKRYECERCKGYRPRGCISLSVDGGTSSCARRYTVLIPYISLP